MTDCTNYIDDLKAYADGELPVVRRAAVRRHLAHCPACREEIAAMTQLTEDLRASEPTDALDADLRARILDAPPVSSRPAPSRRPLSPSLKWALAGLALVAWCFVYPALQKPRYYAQDTSLMATAQQRPLKTPPKFTVRLSDREAGSDPSGPFVQIKNPDSKYQDTNGPGAVQTFDAKSGTVNSAGDLRQRVFNATGALNAAGPSQPQVSNGLGVGSYADSAASPTRQVHREASITVQLANPEATSDTVETMVKETGGFVASNTLDTSDDGLKSAELIVKVPVVQFDTFLAQIGRLGSVQAKNITGEDITEQTSDADSEETVLEGDVARSEARLKALGAKAKWHDEQSTRDLRIQLAQSRARLVLLKRMAALSTITIDLDQTPKKPAPVTGGFLSGLKGTFHDAGQSLVGAAETLLALVIWLLAYAPLWIPALLLGRYGLKEYRKRQAV